MNPQRITLPCGCVVLAAHSRGDRLATCEGGGESVRVNGSESVSRERLESCPGGRAYRLTAKKVTTVMYDVAPAKVVAA